MKCVLKTTENGMLVSCMPQPPRERHKVLLELVAVAELPLDPEECGTSPGARRTSVLTLPKLGFICTGKQQAHFSLDSKRTPVSMHSAATAVSPFLRISPVRPNIVGAGK
jgi:hypothetical protein